MFHVTLLVLSFVVASCSGTYRQCATWDTFCKTPPQIVATKCRLGVPVYWETCAALGYPQTDWKRAASLRPGLPNTELAGVKTRDVLRHYGVVYDTQKPSIQN